MKEVMKMKKAIIGVVIFALLVFVCFHLIPSLFFQYIGDNITIDIEGITNLY